MVDTTGPFEREILVCMKGQKRVSLKEAEKHFREIIGVHNDLLELLGRVGWVDVYMHPNDNGLDYHELDYIELRDEPASKKQRVRGDDWNNTYDGKTEQEFLHCLHEYVSEWPEGVDTRHLLERFERPATLWRGGGRSARFRRFIREYEDHFEIFDMKIFAEERVRQFVSVTFGRSPRLVRVYS